MNRIKEVLLEKCIKQKWLAEKLGKSYNITLPLINHDENKFKGSHFKLSDIFSSNDDEICEVLIGSIKSPLLVKEI